MAPPDRNKNRDQYRRRQQRRKPGQTAREAAGHDRPEVRERREISALVERSDGTGGWTILRAPSPRDASRAAKYSSIVRQLQEGKISPQAFKARISQWRPLQNGERFASDPQRVLAEIERRRAEEASLFVYRSGRAA